MYMYIEYQIKFSYYTMSHTVQINNVANQQKSILIFKHISNL